MVRAEQRHRAAWEDLYQGYAKFYQAQQTQEMRDHVWGWMTAEDNHRAREFYDKVAHRTPWITYDLLP